MRKKQVHVPQDALVDPGGFFAIQLDSDEDGRRVLDVPEVFHENDGSYALDGIRDIGAGRMERLERAQLVADPGAEFVRPAVLRLVAESAEHARIGASTARTPLLVYAIALEAPRLKRAVDLRCDKVPIERRVSAAAEDDGFLSALDRANHLKDQMLFDEGCQMLKKLFFDRFLFRLCNLRRSVLARRAALLFLILVVANGVSSRRSQVSAPMCLSILGRRPGSWERSPSGAVRYIVE